MMARLAMLHHVHHLLAIQGWSALIFIMGNSSVEIAPVLWWGTELLAVLTIVHQITLASQEWFAIIIWTRQSVETARMVLKGMESSALLLMIRALQTLATRELIV